VVHARVGQALLLLNRVAPGVLSGGRRSDLPQHYSTIKWFQESTQLSCKFFVLQLDFVTVTEYCNIDIMTDEMGSSATRIEKLTDSNFHAWKQKIVLILALKDLDEFIEEDPPTDEKELAVWMKSDRKARAVIGLSLSDEHLEHVRDVETAKEMWMAIMNVFERHTLLNKLSARRKFYTVKMETLYHLST